MDSIQLIRYNIGIIFRFILKKIFKRVYHLLLLGHYFFSRHFTKKQKKKKNHQNQTLGLIIVEPRAGERVCECAY